MPLRWPRRVFLLLAVFGCAAWSVSFAAGEAWSSEGWRYGRVEGFEVLSQHGDSMTRRQVREILAVRRTIDFALGFEARYSQPCLLIFHRDKARYLTFLPAEDAELAGRTQSPTAISARKFLRGTEQTALVHYGDIYSDPYTANATIVHNIFQQITPRPPVWFRVGVGNLLRVSDPMVRWNPGKYFAQVLQVIPPLPEIFATPLPPSQALSINLALNDTEEALGPFHHAAALFVHYGLFADGGSHRKSMADFVRLAAEGLTDEATFVACFGQDFATMRTTLRDYMRSPAFTAVNLAAERKKLRADLPALELRTATPAEVARIEGEARAMAGYGGDAHRQFQAAYDAGERDPALLASLGLAECFMLAPERGKPLLEIAAAANVPRPMLYLQLARLRYAAMRAAQPSPETRVTRETAAPILGMLEKARALQPPLAQVYQCFAVLYNDLAEPLTPGDLACLDEGVRHFPRDTELLYAGAKLKRDHGDVTGAAQLIERGMRDSNDSGTRAKFERLRGTLTTRTTARTREATAPAMER